MRARVGSKIHIDQHTNHPPGSWIMSSSICAFNVLQYPHHKCSPNEESMCGFPPPSICFARLKCPALCHTWLCLIYHYKRWSDFSVILFSLWRRRLYASVFTNIIKCQPCFWFILPTEAIFKHG